MICRDRWSTSPMRLLAFPLLMCFAENMAIAADPHWTQVAGKSDYSMVVYLDTNSVKVREGRLTAWIQTNYVSPQRTTDPLAKNYSSSLAIEVFDCESERSAPVSITLFSGQGGEGAVVA